MGHVRSRDQVDVSHDLVHRLRPPVFVDIQELFLKSVLKLGFCQGWADRLSCGVRWDVMSGGAVNVIMAGC